MKKIFKKAWEFLTSGINKPPVDTNSAYGVAVQNGFKGSQKEWLKSIPEPSPKLLSEYALVVKQGYKGTFDDYRIQLVTGAPLSIGCKVEDRPLNRAERRSQLYGNNEEAIQKRRIEVLHNDHAEFQSKLNDMQAAASRQKQSLFTFTKDVLRFTERFIEKYECQAANRTMLTAQAPLYYRVVLFDLMMVIKTYGADKSYQSIAMDLVKFLEHRFKLNGLNSVMYRHKATVHYNERCEGMTNAILEYFTIPMSCGFIESTMVPADYLRGDQMESWERFRKSFYQKAIDVTYASAMCVNERAIVEAATRQNLLEHRNNKKHRARRVVGKTRRRA